MEQIRHIHLNYPGVTFTLLEKKKKELGNPTWEDFILQLAGAKE